MRLDEWEYGREPEPRVFQVIALRHSVGVIS